MTFLDVDWCWGKIETETLLKAVFMFLNYAFQNLAEVSYESNIIPKGCIVLNNAHYGQNLPELLKNLILQMEKKDFFCYDNKIQTSA